MVGNLTNNKLMKRKLSSGLWIFLLLSILLIFTLISLLFIESIILVAFLSVFGTSVIVYLIYLKEKSDKTDNFKKNQIEILKSLVYDLNQNLGHVMGLADKFIEKGSPFIKNKLNENTKINKNFKNEVLILLGICELDYSRSFESFKKIEQFYDKFEESAKRNNIKNMECYLPRVIFTFNLHDDVLNYVIRNIRQFNIKNFSVIRTKLLALRHIHDVYITNIKYIYNFKHVPYKSMNKKRFEMNKEYYTIYYLARDNMFYFVHNFSNTVKDVISELNKDHNMNRFFSEEKKNLDNINKLYEK